MNKIKIKELQVWKENDFSPFKKKKERKKERKEQGKREIKEQ